MKRFAAALGLLLSVASAHAAEPFAQDRIVWNKPTAPFKIIGNVYYVGTAELSVYFIDTPKGAILIEGGLPESVPQIEKNIETLGFKPKDIKLLLVTHAHFDHVGGMAALKKDTGGAVVAMAQDKPFLETGHISFGPSKDVPFAPLTIDRIVHDGETVQLGGVTLTANLTAGHTPGCTTWTMPVAENGTKYEVMFAGSTSVAGNPLAGNSAYPQIADDYHRAFVKLRTMKADVLLTEHQQLSDEVGKAARAKAVGSNPFVDSGALQRTVAESESDFEKQLAMQQAKP